MSLVLAGAEVTAVGLEERVKKAQSLVFLTVGGCLKGIAAVKNPAPSYRRGVFQKAQASVNDAEFPLELGWVFVLPSSRGAGFSHTLLGAARSTTCGYRMFATSRSDNTPMHKTLNAHGFSYHGSTYASNRGDHQLTLFVTHDAQPCGQPDLER
jgi:GNAT superfamily N-acetyltransferase